MAFVNLPPNFQDILYSITDRIAKLETGPNQALYVAESAQGSSAQASQESAQALAEAEAAAAEATAANATAAAASAQAVQAATAAGVAQAQATTALAEATLAYNEAIGSLQPSADTIVNASNQMTAISTNGITVYSGSSASSGARVVMNSTGLAGYNSSGNATFSIVAATGVATFSGNVTGATITGSGLNISGKFIVDGSTGLMTATDATVTGVINATSGYFGTSTNGWSINSTGMVGVGGGTISGGVISGTTFTNGSTFSVTSGGVLTASSGTIGGVTIGASTLTGGTIQTSSGADAVVLSGANNALGIKSGGTFAGWIASVGSGAVIMHFGTTPSSTAYPRTSVSSGAGVVAGSTSNAFSANNNGTNGVTGTTTFFNAATFSSTITMNGTVNIGTTNSSGSVYSEGIRSFTTGSAANTFINSSTGIMARSTASSQRYKHDIVNLVDVPDLNPTALYSVPVRAFRFNEDYLNPNDERAGILVPGFIAEEMEAIYPAATDWNNGQVETWNERMLIPPMLALIQDLDARVKTLEGN